MRILLFFRVNDIHFIDVLNYVSNKKCFVVQEIATNKHFHGVVEIEASSYEAAKKAFQRSLTNKCSKKGGDGSHACEKVGDTDVDLLKIFKYCCKGDSRGEQPDVVYNTWKLESRHILLYHHMYWDINVSFTLDKPIKGSKNSTAPSYIDGVINFMEKHKPGITKVGGFKLYKISEIQRDDLIKLYTLAWYTQKIKTFPNSTQLDNMARTINSQIMSRNYPKEVDEYDKFFNIAKKFAGDFLVNFSGVNKLF